MVWAALTRVLLLYFCAELCFFAVTLSPSVPPDEVTRFGVIEAFSRVLWIPQDGPSTWALGAIEGQPYLYDWIFGRLLQANVLPIPDLIWLRLANALLGLATVAYGLRWIDGFAVSPWARLLFLVVVTNLLMFSGLSAAVSYDNLTNLLAAMGFFHLFRWLRERRPRDLLWLLGAALAGTLTKKTFLPLAAIWAAALVAWHTREGWSEIHPAAPWRPAGRLALAGAGVVVLLGVANVALLGGNLLRYQRLIPSQAQIVGQANAMQNRVVARDRILAAYREGRIPFERALALAQRIQHAGDRRSTRALLELTRKTGETRMGLPTYLATWTRLMTRRTFGYWGHRAIHPGRLQTGIAIALLAGGALLLAIRREGQRDGPTVSLAAWIGLAYAAILLFGVNYPSYLRTGLPDLAVQGRYLFPVLLPLAGVLAVAWADRVPGPMRQIAVPAIAAFFLAGDLPFFLSQAGPAWFTTG